MYPLLTVRHFFFQKTHFSIVTLFLHRSYTLFYRAIKWHPYCIMDGYILRKYIHFSFSSSFGSHWGSLHLQGQWYPPRRPLNRNLQTELFEEMEGKICYVKIQKTRSRQSPTAFREIKTLRLRKWNVSIPCLVWKISCLSLRQLLLFFQSAQFYSSILIFCLPHHNFAIKHVCLYVRQSLQFFESVQYYSSILIFCLPHHDFAIMAFLPCV